MSEENMNLEQVEAEVVEEGAKAVTLDDVTESNARDEQNPGSGESAGTVYEEKVYSTKSSKVFGIVALILGIFSIICCCTCWGGIIAGVAAIIFGIVSIKNEPEAKTIAIVAIVCGSIGTVLGLSGVIFANLLDGVESLFDRADFDSEFFDMFEDLGNM